MAYEASDIHTALGMVASHLGFCLVGRSVAGGSRRDLAFVPMASMKDKAAVFAVTKGESSSLVSAFVETLGVTKECERVDLGPTADGQDEVLGTASCMATRSEGRV